ncbi:MAG TPA: amidohydrolase family protein [Ferruginibacter sp.]|nr:amidohydrolase family protein [Ferruginibacter sp.]
MYRKIQADRLFDGFQFLSPDRVLILDESYRVLEIVSLADAGSDVQYFDGMVLPGFINAHCHIELSHLKRKIPMHTGLVDFVQGVMRLRETDPDRQFQAMQDAEAEMYDSGIVAVGDICNTSASIRLKQNSRLQWHNFIETTGFVPATAALRFQQSNQIWQEFQAALPEQSSTLVPHAPYSVSNELFALINATTSNQIISIHNQESPSENELFLNKQGDFLRLYETLGIRLDFFEPTGKTSLKSWLPQFNRGQQILSVHNSFTGVDDLLFQQALTSSFHYVICIGANQYIENAVPPLQLLWEHGCSWIMGTDSYASNHSLNLWEEVKQLQVQFPEMPETDCLQALTSRGAAALGMQERLGSFKKGKQPGLVQVVDGRSSRIDR